MTKETKIGLLVGLAFIILFAIILSEKGAPQRDAKSPNFATLPNRPDGSTVTLPLQDGGRVPVENHLNPIVQPTELAAAPGVLTEEPVISIGAVDEDTLPPLPEAVVSLLNNTSQSIAAPSNSRIDDEPVGAVVMNTLPVPSHSVTPGPAPSSSRGIFVPQVAPPSNDTRVGPPITPPETIVSDRGVLANRTVPVAPPVDRSATMIPAIASNDMPAVIRATHTVKEGDCVSKIAAEHYGRSTPDRIKLIETANRDVLKPNKGIRVGDKIKIPELAGYEDRFEAVAGFTQPRNAKPEKPDVRTRDASIVSEGTAVATLNRVGEPDRAEPFEIKDGMPRVPRAVPETVKSSNGAIALVPPPVDEHANASFDRSVKENPSPRLSKTRWYEVKSGDTLSGIARRELGNEGQYRAIYKLNRDVLTNKHALKLGTKLRLPMPEDPSLSSSVTTGRTSPGTEP